MLLHRRQAYYFYVAGTERFNPTHYEALSHDFSIIRRKVFDHASSPWEGDNVTLKADLVHLVRNWGAVTAFGSSTDGHTRQLCPISFSEEELTECSHLNTEQIDSDENTEAARNAIGVESGGWVPLEQYDEVKERGRILKAHAL